MNLSVLRLLLRPERGSAATLLIPASAFAIVTALVLTVVGGSQSFWQWSDPEAPVYQTLAAVALVLLVMPLATLGGAAARLSARRRDERLSTLRLLGVTPAGVGAATVVESTLIATLGVLVGIVGSLLFVPLVGLIPFRGEPLGASAVLLSPAAIALVCAAAVLLAAASASLGLRRVVISPLGVRNRTQASGVHWVRAVIAVALLGAAFAAASMLPALAGVISVTVVLAALFAGALAVLGVVGPWVIKVAARRQVRRASTPERLLAARMVLDSPKAAWRQVGGVAMVSFIAVFAGTGVSLMDVMSAPNAAPADLLLVADMRTGLIITLAVSFLMVAASVGVTQAAEILHQRPLHRSLHKLGMPRSTVESARRRAIMSPLLLTTIGSALCAGIVIFPLLGITMIIAPLSLLTIVVVLGAGVGIVWLSTRVTRPMLAGSFTAA